MIMKFVAATQNRHKLAELKAILSGFEIISQQEAGADIDVVEDGQTFEENAYKKAYTLCKALNMPAIADDSGICVDSLDGEPGVYSARYGGSDVKEDIDRNQLLLQNMKDVPDGARGAKFVSCISCVFPDGRQVSARGECYGYILHEPQGNGGFGYDPLFFIPQAGKTMAQITPEEKNKISHRAKALEAFREKMREIGM